LDTNTPSNTKNDLSTGAKNVIGFDAGLGAIVVLLVTTLSFRKRSKRDKAAELHGQETSNRTPYDDGQHEPNLYTHQGHESWSYHEFVATELPTPQLHPAELTDTRIQATHH
jgi:hypothetical protein